VVALEPAVQRAAADAEHFRRGHSVAVHLPQHVEDVPPLDLVELRRRFDAARWLGRTGARRSRLTLGSEGAR
jgi:hypothetical protein